MTSRKSTNEDDVLSYVRKTAWVFRKLEPREQKTAFVLPVAKRAANTRLVVSHRRPVEKELGLESELGAGGAVCVRIKVNGLNGLGDVTDLRHSRHKKGIIPKTAQEVTP
ncbi:hypothetical protein NLJ89_g4962 [Agrocybe chaxingu]|uniref:Uncharacterized protein n=1 Tax=Agrocybe chaxingu TaxID=84603 RepID=A0A9W8MXA2_9AGAR|nr:hypothetical protein NLJ89_g4962 [Agrocybe chaxingu]